MDERQLKKELRESRVKAKITRQDENDALVELLSTEKGRALVRWLLEITHTGHNPFSTNALTTAFQSGELNIGLQLQARIIEVAPDAYIMMLKEPTNVRAQSADRNPGDGNDDSGYGDTGDSSDE